MQRAFWTQGLRSANTWGSDELSVLKESQKTRVDVTQLLNGKGGRKYDQKGKQ